MAFTNGNGGPALTAGQKAAATRRARQAAGLPPMSSNGSKPRAQTWRSAPKVDARGAKLVALAALEDVFVLKLAEVGISPDARKAFDRLQKIKALALGTTTTTEARNEADAALRAATLELVKLTF